MFDLKHLFLSALALTSVVGCADGVDPSDDPTAAGVFVEVEAGSRVNEGGGDVIAAVRVADYKVQFLREPDGAIAVVAVGDSATVVQDLLEAQRATTLETFLALSRAEPPVELVASHAVESRTAHGEARAPRSLNARTEAVHSGFTSCTSLQWDNWHLAQTESYDGRASQYRTTSGDIHEVFYINGSWSARRFDACAGSNVFSPISASVEFRLSTQANWRPALVQTFSQGQRFYYYTLSTAPYRRMWVQQPTNGHNQSYGAGGAWQDPIGLGT